MATSEFVKCTVKGTALRTALTRLPLTPQLSSFTLFTSVPATCSPFVVCVFAYMQLRLYSVSNLSKIAQ